MAVLAETVCSEICGEMAGTTGFIGPTLTGISIVPVVTFEVETGIIFIIDGCKTMDDTGSDVTIVMEVGFVGGVVTVLAIGNVLGFGRMAGDVGVPSVASGFVTDCTVGCWGG